MPLTYSTIISPCLVKEQSFPAFLLADAALRPPKELNADGAFHDLYRFFLLEFVTILNKKAISPADTKKLHSLLDHLLQIKNASEDNDYNSLK